MFGKGGCVAGFDNHCMVLRAKLIRLVTLGMYPRRGDTGSGSRISRLQSDSLREFEVCG
jgi:hypothetical protein